MHVSLIHRPRERHFYNADGTDLDGKKVIRVVAPEKEVGPYRGVNKVEEAAQDTVFVYIADLIESLRQRHANRHERFFFPLHRILPIRVRLKTCLKITIDKQRRLRVAYQSESDTTLGKGIA